MRRAYNWIGVCTALSFAVFVTSCDESPMDAPQQSTTAPTNLPPPSFTVNVGGTILSCMGDESADTTNNGGNTYVQGMGTNQPYDLNCTANDVVIALAEVDECIGCGPKIENPNAPPDSIYTCTEGDTLKIIGSVSMQSNAQQTRGDIGWWVASDGGDGISGECTHFWFDTDGNPDGLDDLDGDVCGDIGSKDFFANVPLEHPQDTLTILCQDTNQDDNADAGACTGWKVPGDDQVCPDDQYHDGDPPGDMDFVKGTIPANKAKCRCDPLDFPIALVREADVTIVKDLNPSSDPGLFDLQILEYDSTTVADSAYKIGDGGSATTTIQWTTLTEGTANKAYVEETNAYLGGNSGSDAFQFYSTSYECKDNGGSGSVVASGSGPGTGGILLDDLENGDDIVCTVTNTRIPVPDVDVSKDTVPTFTRKWTWTIDKKGYDEVDTELTSDTTLALQVDQIFSVGYKVTVTPTSKDTLWNITGTITISVSDTSGSAALDPFGPYVGAFSVVDTLVNGGTKVAATVDCDSGTGGNQTTIDSVKATGSYTCSYDSGELSMGGTWVNTATVDVSWNSGSQDDETQTGSSTHNFAGQTPTTEIDESVEVCDDKGSGPVSSPCTSGSGDYLGPATGSGGTKDFEYDNALPACAPPGSNRLNTARFTTNDTAATDTAQFRIYWTCFEPPDGCTLTQGYWKTHSEFGPAPYDEGWEVVTGSSVCADPAGSPNAQGEGADVEFFDGGQCYYEILWDPGKGGNFFMKLAHQYIAASLNVDAGGSDPSCVSDELADAASLLEYYADPPTGKDNSIPKQGTDWCDTQPGGSACKSYNSDRQYANYLNNVLTMYNEGDLACADHCDDDGLSVLYGTPD